MKQYDSEGRLTEEYITTSKGIEKVNYTYNSAGVMVSRRTKLMGSFEEPNSDLIALERIEEWNSDTSDQPFTYSFVDGRPMMLPSGIVALEIVDEKDIDE
jgi:hypothetical protein